MSSILVAEKDTSLRQVLAEAARDNFPESQVYLARSASDVLAAIPKLRPPSVAVLHWTLAAADGEECVYRLREAAVRILLTSAWDASRLLRKAGNALVLIETGEIEELLRKPFELSEYLLALDRVLGPRPAS